MEKLEQKIKKILQTKFPDFSDADIEKVITDYGKIIILDTIEEAILKFEIEEDRFKFGQLISDDKTDEADEFATSRGINISDIFLEKSKEAITEIFSR